MLIEAASAESSHCGFRSVDKPLEPRSSAGKFLTGILQNQCHLFHAAVAEQLNVLAADRDAAIARKEHNLGSAESCLHRSVLIFFFILSFQIYATLLEMKWVLFISIYFHFFPKVFFS